MLLTFAAFVELSSVCNLLILTNGVVVVVLLLRAGILIFSLQVKARSGAEMDRRLQWWDMIALGVGGMMGAGIFISTGVAARYYAGPAVVVSYLVAGISALLSAFCYTEFAVEMPVAGGAFSYLQITFGAQVLEHLLSCLPSSTHCSHCSCCFLAPRPPRLVATAVVRLARQSAVFCSSICLGLTSVTNLNFCS
jgi:hypothetical protein